MNGIIVVNKEKGYTSFDVVARLRGIMKIKKIGHTGTLDPDATGVLPVCFGSGTKLCDMLTDSGKEYVAEITLGLTTDTQDSSGNLLSEKKVNVTEEEFRAVVSEFLGEIEQIPPMYSAIKINGQRLYELARQGKSVERSARRVVIHKIEILSVELPKALLRIRCSKGTYIRTLCHDIGKHLGCGAVMSSLERTESAGFRIEEAHTLEEIEKFRDEGRLEELIHPVTDCFREEPELFIKPECEKLAENGNKLSPDCFPDEKIICGKVLIFNRDGFFYGVYEWDGREYCYRPVKLFFCETDKKNETKQ